MINTTLIDSWIHTTFIHHGILKPWLKIKVTFDTLNLQYTQYTRNYQLYYSKIGCIILLILHKLSQLMYNKILIIICILNVPFSIMKIKIDTFLYECTILTIYRL